MTVEVTHLFISPGHDFFGRHGLGRESHEITNQEQVELVAGSGIQGDRFFDYKEDYKGQITFFDGAVWDEVRAHFQLPELPVSNFRRNVILRGIDLNELIGSTFSLGDLQFSGSEESKPCYWMDQACAPGVEEFLKGKGGLRCRILQGGTLEKQAYQLSLES